jgi:TPR repeat protein
MQTTRLLTGIVIAVLLSIGSGIAGVLEDCEAAYSRQEYAEALPLCRPLAEQGNAKVQTNLGVMYEYGQGAAQDYAEAVKWYRKAADQGFTPAQYNLGLMYAQGLGVAQDKSFAHMWLSLAAAQGLLEAGGARDKLAANMTPDQIAKAQRLAREWEPKK